MNINEVIDLLGQEYGVPQWRPHGDPLSELVRAILSQNTSDVNSGRAFQGLVDNLGSWEAVAGASVEDVSGAIKVGGLNRIKAGRIKTILEDISKSRGALDLEFLRDLPIPEAKAWLRSLPGVGPKTTGCVLLFALGRPVLPVDTHVYRVSRRLGLIDSTASPEQAHEMLEGIVPPQDVYGFHVNMLAHGRRICRARRPLCHACVLGYGCPSNPHGAGTLVGVASGANHDDC
jgi:endonuclease-3